MSRRAKSKQNGGRLPSTIYDPYQQDGQQRPSAMDRTIKAWRQSVSQIQHAPHPSCSSLGPVCHQESLRMGQDSNQFFFVSNEQLAMYRKIATAWFQGTFLGAFTQPSKQSVILVHAHVDHGTAKYFASIHERFRRIVNTKPCGGNQNNALIILSFKFGAAKHHRLGVWESNLLLRLRHSQNSLRENPQILA